MEEELIRYIAQSLVENPDEVDVYTRETHDLVVIQLQVAPEDTGRVIGRSGRVANAMRSLLRAASRDSDVPVVLEID
ncbi:MAG: KH domain-containing protein [Chloroflexota bacterium]